MPKQTKITKLYQELLEVEDQLAEVKDLYERKEVLLEQIFKLNKGPQLFEIEGEEKNVEVVLQRGHYVFNRPFRLSIKKAS